jgi:hypothetical protein
MAAADSGNPLPTDDEGDFMPLDPYETNWAKAKVWSEKAPDGSLEEIWEKLSDGEGQYLAARSNNSILTIANNFFAFGEDDFVNSEQMTYVFG